MPIKGAEVIAKNAVRKKGITTFDDNHKHEVFLRADGNGFTDVRRGHWHEVTAQVRGDQTVYELSPPARTADGQSAALRQARVSRS